MTRSIRIFEPPKPKPSFSQELEEQARVMADRSDHEASRTAPTTGLEHEIALTLDHLNRVRELHDDERRRLHRWEGTVNNELLQLEPRGPVYVDRYVIHRQILKSRLFKIDDERRKLNLDAFVKTPVFRVAGHLARVYNTGMETSISGSQGGR